MRRLAALAAMVLVVGVVGCSGDEQKRKPARKSDSPPGVVTIRADSDSKGDRVEGKFLRGMISCFRKRGYDIDLPSAARRDLRRRVPRRNYTIWFYDFEGRGKRSVEGAVFERSSRSDDVSVACLDE